MTRLNWRKTELDRNRAIHKPSGPEPEPRRLPQEWLQRLKNMTRDDARLEAEGKADEQRRRQQLEAANDRLHGLQNTRIKPRPMKQVHESGTGIRRVARLRRGRH
jgi:hypothetical protein